jgi:hypothetical protein
MDGESTGKWRAKVTGGGVCYHRPDYMQARISGN